MIMSLPYMWRKRHSNVQNAQKRLCLMEQWKSMNTPSIKLEWNGSNVQNATIKQCQIKLYKITWMAYILVSGLSSVRFADRDSLNKATWIPILKECTWDWSHAKSMWILWTINRINHLLKVHMTRILHFAFTRSQASYEEYSGSIWKIIPINRWFYVFFVLPGLRVYQFFLFT